VDVKSDYRLLRVLEIFCMCGCVIKSDHRFRPSAGTFKHLAA